jgi:NADH:ubiquinone oxidoreductase subunit 4 (subunit M)
LNGFASEFLTILGAFTSKAHLGPRFGALAALGVILSAIYMLHMVGQILFGPLKTPAEKPETARKLTTDLNGREIAILTPLAVLVVLLGVMPTQLILNPILTPVHNILTLTPENKDFASAVQKTQEKKVASCQLLVASKSLPAGN